jgi:mannose-6-phosphate isomerase-like protein (cupin superfamily)
MTLDAIDEPVTGQRVVFRERSGDRVAGELFVRPGGFVPVHVHGCQVERFEGVSGALRFRLGRRGGVLGPGDVLTVQAGTAHGFRNVGDDVAHVLIELTPPLRGEVLIATMAEIVGEAWRHEFEDAWSDAFVIVAGAMIDGAKETLLSAAA